MTNSAIDTPLRERKMQQTAADLTSVARKLTIERGLTGFTVEEVCERVEISRRTFFNYFPSKEDAVIGAHPDEDLHRLRERFLAKGPGGWGKVVDDLVELVIEHFESTGLNSADHAELMSVLEREPRLLVRFMGVSRERDKHGIALVAERENVAADDPRAESAIALLSMLLHTAGERYVRPGNTREFSALLHERLAAMRAVLAPAGPGKATT